MKTFLTAFAVVAFAFACAVRAEVPGMVREGAKEIAKHDMFFISLPEVTELSPDGKVTIEWRTAVPSPPGLAYFGPYFPEREKDPPMFTSTAAEPKGDVAEAHRVTYDIKPAVAFMDQPAGAKKFNGAVIFRVEGYHPKQQRARLFDGRFCFTSEGGVYRRVACIALGPIVANVQKDSAVVWFETDMRTAARIVVREAGAKAKPRVIESPAEVQGELRHEVKISGLKPDRKYAYSVELPDSGGAPGEIAMKLPEYTFRTAPDAKGKNRKITFAVMADSRAAPGGPTNAQDGVNVEAIRRLALNVQDAGAELVMFTGDLCDGYTTLRPDFENQLRTFFRAIAPAARELPFFTMRGNHETLVHWYDDGVFYDREAEDSSERVFSEIVVNPLNAPIPERQGLPPYVESTYSFDYGPLHFTTLTTEYWYTKNPELVPGVLRGTIMDRQMQWLDDDLAAARKRGAKMIFVLAHEPAFPNGGHVGDAMYYGGKKPEMLAMRDRFLGILAKHGVKSVFFAHEHNYSRVLIDGSVHPAFEKKPLMQFIAGGAGAPPAPRERNTPWAANVKSFYAGDLFLLVTADPSTGKLSFAARTPSGRVIDSGTF